MSKFPVYYSGLRLTAALLSSGQWDKTIKGSASTKVNNTLANDSELAGIALGVGTWEIRMLIFVSTNTSATPDFKTQWSFTGTWSTPLRAVKGPGITNVGGSDALTPMKRRATAVNSDSPYGLASSTAYAEVEESVSSVTVSVAGTLALQWAQNTTDAANATTVQAGSYVEVRQLA